MNTIDQTAIDSEAQARIVRITAIGLLILALFQPSIAYSGGGQAESALYEGKSLADWLAAAKDVNPTVKIKADQVIMDTVVPALIEKTKSKDYWTRRGSVEDLGRIGVKAKAAEHAVTVVLQDVDELIRVQAASALKRINPKTKASVPVLVAALRVKDESVRCFAAVAFADFGEEAVQPLLEALADIDPHGRTWAVSSLSTIGLPALPSVVKALDDKNPVIRASCAAAIAGMQFSSMEITKEQIAVAIPALRRLLNDVDPAVREEAAGALRRWEK